MQTLDTVFENVCELDLIYHFDRVNYIIDEIVMAGMVVRDTPLTDGVNKIPATGSQQVALYRGNCAT